MESIDKLRVAGERLEDFQRGNNVLSAMSLCNELADAIEREIAEKYMLLPVDADGVPIHVSEQVELFATGKRIVVYLIGDEWVEDMNGIKRSVYSIRHIKPDPIKELLEDYAGKRFARSNMGLDIEGLADDYAAKIREAVGAK